jgi:molybdopterin-biosynthesis enzyme MoeA-like protein
MENYIEIIIIGDEILSGKRQDKHFSKVLDLAKQNNYLLGSVTYLPDQPNKIEEAIKKNVDKILFSFGGIGATPDDHTRQCAANAYKTDLAPHPEAVSLIKKRFGKDAYPKRIFMGHLPKGSNIIPNIINQIPGFSINNHFFVPGFPEMAWPMIEWIFKNKLPKFDNNQVDHSIIIKNIAESLLIDLMIEIENQYPLIKMYCLPKITPQKQVELGVKGDKVQANSAIKIIKKNVKELGYDF